MKKHETPNPLVFFRGDVKSGIAVLLILSILHLTYSCSYYTYKLVGDASSEKAADSYEAPNYIIVHQDEKAFHLNNLTFDQHAETIKGTLVELPKEHKSYLTTKLYPGKPNRYTPSLTPQVHNEVHLYVYGLSLNQDTEVTIPLDVVRRIEVYDRDIGTSILAFSGGALAFLAAITAVYLLTKSSCPFIYLEDGTEYTFLGEINSGAIFRNLERDDFLLLPSVHSDSISLIIANRLKEKQFINQMSLIEVAHHAETSLMIDKYGAPHTIKKEEPVQHAYIDGSDITRMIANRDSLNFTFDSDRQKDYFNEVVFTFNNQAKASKGHLVLRGKNSLWGDYVFGEFTKLFGRNYSSWIEKQNNSPKPDQKDWAAEQGLSMILYMEQGSEWVPIDTTFMVGPMSYRDWVIPIDLGQQEDTVIKLKLRSGFMLWDLDYLAMDFSADEDMVFRNINPVSAINQDGENMILALSEKDDLYMEQPMVGDQTVLTFPVKKSSSESITYDYILYSRGYYNHIRDYVGEPDLMNIYTFRKPGRFSQFSKEKLDETMQIVPYLVSSPTLR